MVHRGSGSLGGGELKPDSSCGEEVASVGTPHCAEGEEEKGRGSKTVTRLEAGSVWDGRWSYSSR